MGIYGSGKSSIIKSFLKKHNYESLTVSLANFQNENAVKIQIYCAIIAYCLVAICGSELKSKRKIYEILQILSISLFDKTPVKEMVTNIDYNKSNKDISNQLNFNYF